MILRIAMVWPTLLAMGYAQTAGGRPKAEFEVASIRANPPRAGFHFAIDSNSGGADLSNPGMFRCSNCTLATLIRTAFHLQNYQIPGRSSLGANTFEVMAKMPDGATQEDVPAMLQNMLKDRFGLAYHYKEQTMRGYQLVIAKNGSKLKESTKSIQSPAGEDPNRQQQNGNSDQHRFAQGEGHTHNGLVAFNGSATYRGEHKTTAELAQILSDQLGVPVDDQTKLQGKYDIYLNWAGNLAQSGGNHGDGAGGGGAGHGDHNGGGPVGSPRRADESGPGLSEALQSQLGLKLVPSERSVARIFVVEHAEQLPTAN